MTLRQVPGRRTRESFTPPLDPGIARAVIILDAEGVETYESCEGGPGHSYPEPSIRFHGTQGGGWHAVSVCLDFGLKVSELRRVWVMDEGVPTGPYWELTFVPSSDLGARTQGTSDGQLSPGEDAQARSVARTDNCPGCDIRSAPAATPARPCDTGVPSP